MSDINNSSQSIESIAESNSIKVSKDLNDNSQINAMFAQLSDQTNALNLSVINSAFGATPTVLPIAGKYESIPTTYGDGDAAPILLTATGKVQVEATLAGGGSGGTSETDDSAFTLGTTRVTPAAGIYIAAGDSVDSGDTGAFRMTAERVQYVQPFDGTNLMPMQDAVGRAGYSIRTDGINTAPTMDVNTRAGYQIVTDGTNDLSITASGFAQMDIAAQSLTALAISKDANANSEINPIFTQDVSSVISGIEVVDYNPGVSVAAAVASNHDYTVTSTKTLKVQICRGSSSGAQKAELQTGPVASLSTVDVAFCSQVNMNWQMDFRGLLEVPDTGTGTIRIIRTNREKSLAMDVYSTIIGTEV